MAQHLVGKDAREALVERVSISSGSPMALSMRSVTGIRGAVLFAKIQISWIDISSSCVSELALISCKDRHRYPLDA
jgi:hypothetical protein